jgi:hypothetical protein
MPSPQGLTGLRELDLCGNQIQGPGALAVARAVARLPHLDSLQLDENEISDGAVAAIKVHDAGQLHVGLLRSCCALPLGGACVAVTTGSVHTTHHSQCALQAALHLYRRCLLRLGSRMHSGHWRRMMRTLTTRSWRKAPLTSAASQISSALPRLRREDLKRMVLHDWYSGM